MSLKKLWIALGIFAGIGAATRTAQASECISLSLINISLRIPGELRLVPQSFAAYPEFSRLSGNAYIEGLYLELEASDNVARIAATLSMGRDPGPLEVRIRTLAARDRNRVPVDKLLPDLPAKMIGKKACEGANCFNAALSFHDSSQGIRHTTGTEGILKLRNDFEQVPEGSQLQYGDIVAVWLRKRSRIDLASELPEEFELLHMAVYLDGNVFFHKASSDAVDPYVFETAQSVMKKYKGWDPIVTVHRSKDALRNERPTLLTPHAPSRPYRGLIKP